VRILRATVHPYTLPLYGGLRTEGQRRGWLVRLDDDAGRTGWGELVTWPGFGSRAGAREPQRALTDAVQEGSPLFQRDWSQLDLEPVDQPPLSDLPPETACALEVALLDLLGQARGVSLAALLAGPQADLVRSLDSHVLVRGVDDAERAVAAGAQHLKLKVGLGDVEADVARVGALRRAVGDDMSLRLDANGCWDRREALRRLARLAPFDLEWIEQPVTPHDLDGLAAVRAARLAPVAADEALTGPLSLARLIDLEAADVVVLKAPFVGGPRAARALARAALTHGLAVCVTHALETRVGRAAALHLAASLGPPPAALAGGLLPGPLRDPRAPLPLTLPLELPRAPGLGVSPRPEEALCS
jgi:o-succinylbenzoate synthase